MDIFSVTDAFLTAGTTRLNAQVDKTVAFESILKNTKDDRELMSACREFEAYFIQMMLREMRKTIDTSNSLIPKSNAEKIFEDMLDEEYANIAAKQGDGMGLAQTMYNQMKRQRGIMEE